MNKRSCMKNARSARRGALLIMVLVCMVIVMAIVGGMLQASLRNRRQIHAERDRRQTELLLQAGIERARQRTIADPKYQGEKWSLPAEEVVGRGAAEVTIEIVPATDEQQSQLRVTAEYPIGSPFSIRRGRTLNIFKTPSSQE